MHGTTYFAKTQGVTACCPPLQARALPRFPVLSHLPTPTPMRKHPDTLSCVPCSVAGVCRLRMAAVADQPAAVSTIDVETYISNYCGHQTRLKRLHFIAQTSKTLKADALRIALDEVKRSTWTAMYSQLLALADSAVRDDAWIDSVDRKATQMLEKLEADLASHKSSLIKESIRVAFHPQTFCPPPLTSPSISYPPGTTCLDLSAPLTC